MLWKIIFIVVYVKMGSYMKMAWHGMAWKGMEMAWHGKAWKWNSMECLRKT
jgi:hypothetical protein